MELKSKEEKKYKNLIGKLTGSIKSRSKVKGKHLAGKNFDNPAEQGKKLLTKTFFITSRNSDRRIIQPIRIMQRVALP